MNCASCGATIGADARFCHACGALVAVDPAERPPTPAHLAARIRAERPALEGERKHVTILFADVADSLELARGTDPEEWRAVMDRCFQLLAVSVHAFEGTVDKFTGDGIMAIFGAPIAHEDHARRACLAALEMRDGLAKLAEELRESHGIDLRVRIGLNSGEVVVGSIGEQGDMAYTAVGHTVGLAQRMEQIARSGEICLSSSTAELVRGYFLLSEPISHEVRGAGTVDVYELERAGEVRGTLDAARARGLTRFVGREEELTTLERAFESSLDGAGQLVGIVGEPGIGKSRLCHELAEHCRERGIPVYHVAAQAHTQDVSLRPVLTLMREYFGISDAGSDELARERVEQKLDLLGAGLADELPLLLDFLGIGDPERPVERMDPEARHRRLLDLVRRLVHAQGQLEPSLTIFEDLQWIDPASDVFLHAFVEAAQSARGLTVVSFRPDYRADWMSRSFYRQIPLPPLGGAEARELVHELLGSDPSVEWAAGFVIERADGNPFFAEELVRALLDAGSLRGERGAYELAEEIVEAEVPATVQAVIAARIDRLDPAHKAALEAAAVIGKEFPAPLLGKVAGLDDAALDDALRALVAAEFIVERLIGPEPAYAFRHPLTQEVAYRSQLRERRKNVHADAARAIGEHYPEERLDEHAGLVAGHWQDAGEKLEAARWHARAATWSGYNDPAESLRHWRQVAELADELGETEEAAALGLVARVAILHFGWRLGLSGEEAEAIFRQAEKLAAETGYIRWRVLLLGGYGAVKGMGQGDIDEYARLARDAIALIEESGDDTLYLPPNAYAFFLTGDLDEGMDVLDRAIAAADGDPTVGAGVPVACPYALCLAQKGQFQTMRGELEASRRILAESREVASEYNDLETLSVNHGLASRNAYVAGDGEEALEHGRLSVEISERIGNALHRTWAWTHLGAAEELAGNWQRAIEGLERAEAIATEHRTAAEARGPRLGLLARAKVGAGEHDVAVRLVEEARAASRAQGGPVMALTAVLAFVRVGLAVPGPFKAERIEAELSAALELCLAIGARGYEPIVRAELAELALRVGETERAERERERALELFELNGAQAYAERLRELGARVGAGKEAR